MAEIEEPQLLSALPLDPYEVVAENRAPPSTGSENQLEEEAKWDVFELSSDEWKDNYRTGEFGTLTKLLKIVVYLITFFIALSSAVISKGSLLLLTSGIKRKNNFSICGDGECIESIDRHKYDVAINDRRPYIWCLLLALFFPEVLTFFQSVRICIFKQFTTPRFYTFLFVLAVESCQVIGLFFMLFVVFPEVHYLKAISLAYAVFIVPSLLNFLSNWNTDCNRNTIKKSTLDLIAFLLLSSVVILYISYALLPSGKLSLWTIAICLLVSCAWWENFADVNSRIFEWLTELQDDIEECRQFIYIFIPIWKIILLLAICMGYMDDNKLFTDFKDSFGNLTLSISIEAPLNHELGLNGSMIVLPVHEIISNDIFIPVQIASAHVLSSFLCYICAKFTCKICIQGFSYALPILLSVPATFSLIHLACVKRMATGCCNSKSILPYSLWNCPEENIKHLLRNELGFVWILCIVSQIWLTHHIWTSNTKRMASTNELFINPTYCSALIDQFLALNRRINRKTEPTSESIPVETDETRDRGSVDSAISRRSSRTRRGGRSKVRPRIIACATMWHETPDEMEQLLKSIMRMDNDQCLKRTFLNTLTEEVNKDFYHLETHIFFDDAFVISDEDDTKMVINKFVKDLIESVDTAASKIYPPDMKLCPPAKVPTPYGGRLIWKLQGENTITVHMKNKDLIRHKKRWSQVMYMYYFLGYRLLNSEEKGVSKEDLANNTFILALDGDIDFKPEAVQLLVDLMKRNDNLGAACGRIHPVGTGMMVYYQKFEYAIGHWLQKATEHMIGCVLCSPGCFSLFRAKSLMESNVVRRYATESKEAIEYVQFDQGEDRWLCTLLLQSGSRVEYSAASDAYTHCPESFAEFYTQRRRWAPSTMANIMDLLVNYKKTVECNDNISLPYIGYQSMMMVGSVLGPGTIFLMLVGAMVTGFGISNWQSLIANFFPVAFFIVICFVAKNDTQILVAEIFSAAYALLMMTVIVAISLQMVEDGIASPTAIFLLAMTASFIIAAILHPREFSCVFHGLIYFLSVPSMYMLLTLYSIINLHVVSWGTREVATKKTKKQLELEKLEEAKEKKKTGIFDWFNFLSDNKSDSEEEGSITFGLANLFRCMCCTYPRADPTKLHLVKIGEQLETLNLQMENLQRQINPPVIKQSVSGKRASIHIPSRDSPVLITVSEGDQDDYDEENTSIDEDDDTSNTTDERWLLDPALENCPLWRINEKEEKFWKELIKTYLYPLLHNAQEKTRVANQLLDLRNKVAFGMLMLNSLFILIVFLLQMKKDILYIEWPFSQKTSSITFVPDNREVIIDLEYLQLEPINLFLVFFFSIVVVIQFMAMLFHRFQTISHILASTELSFMQDYTKPEVAMAQLPDILQQLNLSPGETINTINETDGRSMARRQSVVAKLDQKIKGVRRRQSKTLREAYEETLTGLMQDSNNSKIQNKLKRLSLNPAVLGGIRRLSVQPSPQSSIRSNIRNLPRLNEGFPSASNSLRHTYTNAAFEESIEEASSSFSELQERV